MFRSLIRKSLFVVIVLIGIISNEVHGQADEQLVAVGTEMYRFGDKRDALDVFKQAIQANPNNAQANYMAGKCIIETINKDQSLHFFLEAYRINPEISFDILYLIGYSYQLGYKLHKATDYYNQYLKTIPIANTSEDNKIAEINKTERKIYECKVARELVKHPIKVNIQDLGATINSTSEDYAPVVSSNQDTIYFTSRRKGSTGNNKDNDNEFYEDIYVTFKSDSGWSTPKNLGAMVNSDLHESTIGLSPSGKELYVYRDNDKVKGDIFVSKINPNGTWSTPTPFSSAINTAEYIENSISFTPDGKTIFFSSNRAGGKGGMDIYTSTLDAKGNWSSPKNLGDTINTEHDDEAAYIASDGITLYFSSKGHEGMGGFDVFKSKLDTATQKWSLPINLQYPINSTDDDIYFSVSKDGKTGYFSSVKENGVGDVDLFKISINELLEEELAAVDSLTKMRTNDTSDVITVPEAISSVKAKTDAELDNDGTKDVASNNTNNNADKSQDNNNNTASANTEKGNKNNKNNKGNTKNANETSNDENNNTDNLAQNNANSKGGKKGNGKKGNMSDVEELNGENASTKGNSNKNTQGNQQDNNGSEANNTNQVAANTKKIKPTIHLFVTDKQTRTPINCSVEVRNGKNILFTDKVNGGEFTHELSNTKRTRYTVTVQQEGYLFKSIYAWVDAPSDQEQSLEYKIELDKITVGAKCVMRNIFFDTDKYDLNEQSVPELNKLLTLLKQNASLRIEIDGHTDNVGNADYNKALSKHRAESVMRWLIQNGINSSRLVAKGFGKDVPLASNDDEEEGRELNRRTEFVILHE